MAFQQSESPFLRICHFLILDNKILILVPQNQSTPVNPKKMTETSESQDWLFLWIKEILFEISNFIEKFFS